MVASRGSDQFPVRFPEGMRARLRTEAADAGRSMNSEIIHRLEAYEAPMHDDEPETGKKFALTIRLSAETRAKLDALSTRGPYRISLTSIVERGIELAAKELEQLK